MSRLVAAFSETVLCECGCGLPAPLTPYNDATRGYVKGQPRPRRRSHNGNPARTPDGRSITMAKGYVLVRMPEHPRADHKGYVAEHIAIAQEALGKPLPAAAHVHHVNQNKADNRRANLVICQDAAYHKLLHVRARIKAAGGNPNTDRICSTCQRVLPIEQFHPNRNAIVRECRACVRIRGGFQPWRPGGLGRPPRVVAI